MAFPDNGGIYAPPRSPQIGLSVARTLRRQRSIKRSRGRRISRAISQRQRAHESVDSGPIRELTPPPARQTPPRRGPAVAQATNATIGRQLERRVKAGEIDMDRAEQVARDRQILEAAYGPDWRIKVFGGRGIVRNARLNLKRNPADPQLQAFNKILMENRKRALERAKSKLQ